MEKFYPLPEWHPQDAIVLVWPHRYSDWVSTLENIELCYLSLVKEIAATQAVLIIYFDHQHREYIQDQCSQFGCNIQTLSFLQIETNDTWVRDYGPLFLLGNNHYKYLDFEFNAWGEQYAHRLDYLFSESLYKVMNINSCEYARLPLVLEGGNLDFNDNATVLTNLKCITRNNTGAELKIDDLLTALKETLSVKKVLGIQAEALAGDDTGGHIDTLARFIKDDTIVYAATNSTQDPNYACLNALQSQLMELVTRRNTPYKLVPILMPINNILDTDSNILPASYINFIFTNNSIIVPRYNDDHDSLALREFERLRPDRKIVGIDATELIQQFGSLHCATLHLPANTLNESRINTTN